jgi:hypothetical protein
MLHPHFYVNRPRVSSCVTRATGAGPSVTTLSHCEVRTMNATWHKQHPMPMGSAIGQRVEWHVAHAKACRCRAIPPTVIKELRRLGQTPPKRNSVSRRTP